MNYICIYSACRSRTFSNENVSAECFFPDPDLPGLGLIKGWMLATPSWGPIIQCLKN